MKALLLRYIREPYFRNAAIFFCGSGLVAFLNYLRYPVMSRLLPIEAFGEVQALFVVSGVFGVVFTAFSQASLHATVHDDELGNRAAVLTLLRDASLTVVGILCVIVVCTAPWFANALHFTRVMPFFQLVIILSFSALYNVRTGFLQGKGRFGKAFIASALIAGGGLLGVVYFTHYDASAIAAIEGVIFGQLLGLAYAWYHARHALVSTHESPTDLTREQKKRELFHVFLVFCVIGFVNVMYTTDILMVKYFFDPQIAGFYSAISTVANIVVFATAPLTAVMLPHIKRSDDAGSRAALKKALGTVALVGGGVALFFSLFPEFVVKLLMGTKFLGYAWLLPYQVCAFFMVALANVLALYGLARRMYRLTFLAFFDSFALILLVFFRHESLMQIVQNYILTGMIALAGAALLMRKELTVHA